MPARFGVPSRLLQGSSQLRPFLFPIFSKFPQSRTLVLGMTTDQSISTKRPTCPSCSKPIRICLCNRFHTPTLNNSVAITILQHSLEKKHPLNSTRIATIGLKNVDVATVSDVNFQARFFMRLLDSSCAMGPGKLDATHHLFDEMPSTVSGQINVTNDFHSVDEHMGTILFEKSAFPIGNGLNSLVKESGCGEVPLRITSDDAKLDQEGQAVMKTCMGRKVAALASLEAGAITFTIEKHGALSSCADCWVPPNKHQRMSFDELLASDKAVDVFRKGFVVTKLLVKKHSEGSNVYEESEEFEVTVPPGSVLLFPSESSVDVAAINFEVKNLIVLDGTWAKAKRMYNENPWLKLLPHLRLSVLDKSSLYGEVRHQPRAGYLSTIESIVYAMKAVGEEREGLDCVSSEMPIYIQDKCVNLTFKIKYQAEMQTQHQGVVNPVRSQHDLRLGDANPGLSIINKV